MAPSVDYQINGERVQAGDGEGASKSGMDGRREEGEERSQRTGRPHPNGDPDGCAVTAEVRGPAVAIAGMAVAVVDETDHDGWLRLIPSL